MFTECYGTQFRRSTNALNQIYDDSLRPAGIRLSQLSLLRTLIRLGPTSFAEIATEAALDRTTISRNLRLLIDAGWVDVFEEEGKREKIASISRKGRALVRKAEPLWADAQKRVEEMLQRYLSGPAKGHLIEILETIQRHAGELQA